MQTKKVSDWQEFEANGFKNKVVSYIYDKTTPTDGGVPLGGLGTGYITLDTSGHFGKTTIFNNYPTPLTLNSPVFAITSGNNLLTDFSQVRKYATKVAVKASSNELRIISTKAPEGLKGVENLYYWGHFPIVDMEVILDIPVKMHIRAFSPFILNDANSSNIPAIFFEVILKNCSKSKMQGNLIFNLVIPKNPEKIPSGKYKDNRIYEHKIINIDSIKAVVADGPRGSGIAIVFDSSSQFAVGKALDLSKIPLHPPLLKGERGGLHEQDSNLHRNLPLPVIPAKAGIHYSKAFDQESPGTMLLIPYELNPHQEKTFNYSLGWYFPFFTDSGGEPHKHHYSKNFKNALESAQFLFNNSHKILNNIIKWQSKIYSSEDYPDWLRDSLINGLYSMAKNTLWLINDRPDNWYPKIGFFTHSESFTGCPITETMVCRMHGHFPTLFFFPELERSTLEAFKHYQLMTGEVPFCFGRPTSHRDPIYYCQHPLNSGEYVQMVYRYYLRTGDKEFLKEFYKSVKKAIQFSMTLDYDGDGLVNDHSHALEGESWPANQFYDIWPWYGTSSYVAGIWLATLTCGIEIAKIIGDDKFAAKLKDWLKRGKKSFIDKLWNGKYFRLYNDPENGKIKETSLANQLMGQWCVKILGLPNILPEGMIHKALDSIERLNFKATEYGLVNGVNPDGTKECSIPDSNNDHARQIFIGENLCSSMTFLYHGRKKIGLEIAKRMSEAIAIKHRTPWNIRCLISSDDGRPIWGDDYYSNMVIWALPLALSGKNIANINVKEI